MFVQVFRREENLQVLLANGPKTLAIVVAVVSAVVLVRYRNSELSAETVLDERPPPSL